MILANLRVAYDVVTPTHHMHPGIVAVPLDARTDVEISGMFVGDPDAFAATVKHDFERRVLELLR